MALRFTVQGDDEHECAEGLRALVEAGLEPAMDPRMVTAGRWIARAKPAPAPMTKAPADDGRGPAMSG